MDATTEAIAHFFGYFRLNTDFERLREQYEQIDRGETASEAMGDVAPLALKISAPHTLEGYDPKLAWQPEAVSELGVMAGVPQSGRLPFSDPDLSNGFRLRIDIDVQPFPVDAPGGVTVRVEIPPPSSVVNFTWQSAWLSDDDLFYHGDPTDAFADTGDLHAAFDSLVQMSSPLVAFEVPQVPASDWAEFAEEVLLDLEAFAPRPSSDQLETHLRVDADATGTVVNGETVDELPTWSDHLPVYLRSKWEDEQAEDEQDDGSEGDDPEVEEAEDDDPEENGAESPLEGGGSAAEGDGAAPGTTPGEAIAGEASSADEGSPTVRSSSEASTKATETTEKTVTEVLSEHDFSRDFEDWQEKPETPDSDEIVSGANLAINEINVKSSWLDAPVMVVRGDVVKVEAVSQVNVLAGTDALSAPLDALPSTSMNVAEIVRVSSEEEEQAAEHAEQDTSDPALLPQAAEGEPETAEVEPEGSDATPPAPPPAEEPEAPEYTGLPQNWSVTRITGDVQAVNWVKQYTFVTDFDRAVVETSTSTMHLITGANEISNIADFAEFGFHYDLIFVSGDMIDVSLASQMNVLFDADFVEVSGGGWEIVGGDNLLYNEAVLTTRGIDEITEMKAAFANAAEELAAGAETIAREVAQDALFTGTGFLQVLQIDGDFVAANVLEQINMVGDADRIRDEMNAIGAEAEAKLIAGSNALVNLASIEKLGMDTKIMAAGQVYEDAMLYQAELIEENALPSGVGLAPLVNEAIAFLADGLIQPPSADEIAEGVSDVQLPGDSDVMQTMLA